MRALDILAVEDDVLLRALLEDMLEDLGHVSAAAGDVTGALGLLQDRMFDCAILDVQLNGETSYAVATELRQRHIPFFFLTGFGNQVLPAAFADRLSVIKPYRIDDLRAALTAAMAAEWT